MIPLATSLRRRFPSRRRLRYESQILTVYNYEVPAWVTGAMRATYALASRAAIVLEEHSGPGFNVTVSCGGRRLDLWRLETPPKRFTPLATTQITT